MEVYNQIKTDLYWVLIFTVVFYIMFNSLDIGIDETDKDGWNRSGVSLITDYGTGKQYLYRGGAIIERDIVSTDTKGEEDENKIME